MTEHDVRRYVDEAAARAAGAEPAFPEESGSDRLAAGPAIDDARRHLDEAWRSSDAGTELPDGARMRIVKGAVLRAVRPITARQVPFNREIAVAVKELAMAVEHLTGRADIAERVLDTSTTRVQATLATSELTIDDLSDTVERLTDTVDALVQRAEHLEQQLAHERSELRALRARQDLVLRTARSALDRAVGSKAERRHLAKLAAEVDHSAELLAEELADATHGTRDEVRAGVEELLAEVATGTGSGPVVDLGCGRGEWLEALRDRGVDSYGVDTSDRMVQACAKRGLDVRGEEAIAHLADLPESSLAAITALHLVERLTTESLLELVDRALVALRPGGVLLLEAANPTNLQVGAADFWLDPARRRPVHPRLLELVVLARGFAEAEVRWLHPADKTLALRPEDLAGDDPVRATAVVEHLNRALAGPRDYAVVARKPGATALDGP